MREATGAVVSWGELPTGLATARIIQVVGQQRWGIRSGELRLAHPSD